MKTSIRDGVAPTMTLDEVGKALNVTRERVRQIETMALRKLRLQLSRRGLTAEDFFEVWQRTERDR